MSAATRQPPNAGSKRIARRGVLALFDQALVSGPRFVTTILVGRFCLERELGIYQLGFTLLVFATAVQESLITSPYTVFRECCRPVQRKHFAGSTLVHSLVLWLICCFVFAVASFSFGWGLQPSQLGPLLAVLAIAVPLALSRELARRMALSELRVGEAAWVDGGVAVLQLGALGVLAYTNNLNPVTAMLAIAGACAVVVGIWAVYRASSFAFSRALVFSEWRNSWRFGRWVSAAQLAGVAQMHGMYWIVLFMLGEESTGLMAACALPAMFANPLVMGINNVLTPMAARAASQGDFTRVRQLIGSTMLVVTLALCCFCLGLWLFGGQLMRVFGKQAYMNQDLLVLLFGMNALFVSIKMICDAGFWATQMPKVVFRACSVGTLTSIGMALVLIPRFDVHGAAVSLIVGSIIGTLYQTYKFFGRQGWQAPAPKDEVLSGEVVL